jgi:hypothetical protein
MEGTGRHPRAAIRLGFWSAIAVTLILMAFPLSLILGLLTIAYGSAFLLAPAFVTMMVSIDGFAALEKGVWSHLGLLFAVIYAAMCSLTYYIQLTLIRHNYLPVAEAAVLLFVFIPGTPLFAQIC